MSEKRLVKMVSDSKHNYEKRVLKSGDDFECTDEEAQDLEALKMAHRAPVDEQGPSTEKASIDTRALGAEPQSAESTAGPRPRRTYARRDLTADK